MKSGNTFDNMIITDNPAEDGKLKLMAGKFYGDAKLDQGTQTSQDTGSYGMSAELKEAPNTDKAMVI